MLSLSNSLLDQGRAVGNSVREIDNERIEKRKIGLENVQEIPLVGFYPIVEQSNAKESKPFTSVAKTWA
jgi:hypothetical protein